jgi:hypothetical protein
MTKLTCAAIASLDGYVEVEEGRAGREGRVLPDASDGIQREDVMYPC